MNNSRTETEPLAIAVTGSHGLIGNAVVNWFESRETRVLRVARNEFESIPEGVSAVIHLAGANIAEGRWTGARKREIRDSRIVLTERMVAAIGKLRKPPRVLLCASGSGYYGDRGDELLAETSPAGDGFLADVCKEWEQVAGRAGQFGVRVIQLRFGIVLSHSGSALDKMMAPFRWGVGGHYGTGSQYMSWITIEDTLRALSYCIETEKITGAVNFAAPSAITNRAFMKTLAGVMHRPAPFPVPGFALKMMLGEMAQPLLLNSTRMVPEVLLANGFTFQFPELEPTLSHLL